MTVSNWIEVVSIICSSILSIIAIAISVLTLRQNNKMIFESNKPNLIIFSKIVSFTSPYTYLVLKNFGNSGATILNIEYNKNISSYFGKEPFKRMSNVYIAPNQPFVYPLKDDFDLEQTINFKINYLYLNKTYSETHTVKFSQLKDIPSTKVHISKNMDIKELSSVLQEMTIQNI